MAALAGAGGLYEVLGVLRDAPPDVIKRAYLKQARQTHPDKCPGDDTAHARFQALGRAYATLSDPEKRRLYDATGMVDDLAAPPGDGSWADFWTNFYERVTVDKLDKMSREYKGSAEEAADLHREYRTAKGDMNSIMDSMMFSIAEDEPRFRDLLQAAIENGELPKYRAFSAESAKKHAKRQQKAAREAAEAKEHAKTLGAAGGNKTDLHALILGRQAARAQAFDSLLGSLAEKYDSGAAMGKRKGPGKQGGKPGGDDPMDDEAFEAARQQLLERAAKGKSAGKASKRVR